MLQPGSNIESERLNTYILIRLCESVLLELPFALKLLLLASVETLWKAPMKGGRVANMGFHATVLKKALVQ